MKIFVLHHKFETLGGAEKLCLTACEALMEDGHDVKLFCGAIPRTLEKIFGRRFNVQIIPMFKPFKPLPIKRFLIYQSVAHFTHEMKKIDFEVADAIFNTHNNILLLPSQKCCHTIQCVYFPIDFFHKEETVRPKLFWDAYYYPIIKSIRKRLNNVDNFIGISKFTKELVKVRWSEDADVIYPPVEINEFLNNEEKTNQIVTVGRFSPKKRYETLLKIASEVPQIQFFIIGVVGKDKKEYYVNIKKFRPSNVHLLADFDFLLMKKILAESRFYLHTMIGEHFGISIVEAMASGCIPIVHRSGGALEYISHNKNGMFYSDWREAVEIIKLLMKFEDTKLKRMKNNAIKEAKNFDVSIFKKRIKTLFKNL